MPFWVFLSNKQLFRQIKCINVVSQVYHANGQKQPKTALKQPKCRAFRNSPNGLYKNKSADLQGLSLKISTLYKLFPVIRTGFKPVTF